MSELNYKSDIVEVYVKSDIITLNITNSVLGGTGGGGGASYLDDLTDVTITAPASGEFIRYNGTVWVDATIQTGDLPSGLDALKIADGSVSNTEFQYLNGVTSAIQTQIDGKAASSHTHAISDVTNLQTTLDGKAASSHTHVISDVTGLQTALDGKAAASHTHSISDVTNLQTSLDGKVDENAAITGATKTKITYDSKGLVTAGADITASDLPTGIDATKIANGTVNNTEFQYLDGVTSAIQTQLNSKASTSHSHALDDLTDVVITTPSSNQVLKYNGTNWINDTSPAGATNLDGLTDVTITGAATGEYLRYNGTAWVDATIQAGDLPTAIDAAKIADGTVSNTEFQYINGVTSAIQTQLDGKASSTHTHAISDITSLQTSLDGKVDENAAITGATKTKITYDAKGLVTAGADANLDDLGDVTITTASNGQVLTYNGTAWVNTTPSTGGTVTSVAMTVPTGFSITGTPITTSGTLALTFASGYELLNNTTQTIAGAKTFSSAPTLSTITSSLLKTNAAGLVQAAVAGTDYLTSNQSINVSGDASGSGSTAITLTLATVNSNVGTFNNVTVNAKGLVTSASNVSYLTGNQTITLSGDISGSGATSISGTLANAAITGKTQVTAATGDLVLISDASDSNNLKKATIQSILDLAGTGTTGNMNAAYSGGAGGTTIAATETSIGTVTITPQNSGSKIQVVARMVAVKDTGTTRRTVTVRVKRGTTQVGQDCVILSQNVSATDFGPAVVAVIDTHGSSSAITYTLYALCDSASGASSEHWEIGAIELIGPKGDAGTGLSDGDKGDISVSASGATWTIDNAAVTYAKVQNVAANTFLANATGSSATVQEIATNRIPLFSSAITGTPSSSNFLRGDGSWQTVTAGASALDDLTDVVITSATNGQVLQYNGTNWVNATASGSGTVTSVAMTVPTGLTVTGSPITSSGTLALTLTAGYDFLNNTTQTIAGAKTFSSAPTFSTMTAGSVLFAGTGGLVSQSNANLFWDNTNGRLGVGTTSPAYKIDVNGSARFYGGTSGVTFGSGTTINLSSDAYMQATSTGTSNAGYLASRASSTSAFVSVDLITAANTSSGWSMQMTPNNTNLEFVDRANATTTRLIIFNGGNVAIGTTTNGGFKFDVSGTARVQDNFTLSDAKNFILGTSTGNKIGTATSQKIGFWNATPIVQPTTAVAAATFVESTGTNVNEASTFDGYTIKQVVKALRNAGLLA